MALPTSDSHAAIDWTIGDPAIRNSMVKSSAWNYSTTQVDPHRAADSASDAGVTSLMIVQLVICIVGTIGNLLVIFVVLVLREYKKAVTHWYVLQLAISDAIFLLTIPAKVQEELNDQWMLSEGACKANEAILFLNYYASILFLAIMSIDRYIAVCHGFSSGWQKLRTKRAAYIATVAVWIVALLLCTPILLYSHKMGEEPHCRCRYQFPNDDPTTSDPCADYEDEESYELCTFALGGAELCARLPDETGMHDTSEGYSSFVGGGYASYQTAQPETKSMETLLETGSAQEPYATDQPGMRTVETKSYHIECNYHDSGLAWKGFLVSNFVFMFLAPLSIISFCYTLIIHHLKKKRMKSERVTDDPPSGDEKASKKKKKRSKSIASQKEDRKRNRVTAVCGLLVLLFVICWLPYHSAHMAKIAGIERTSDYCITLMISTSILAYVNSALNPYLYNCIGFKKRFGRAVGSIRQSVRQTTSSLSGSTGTVRYNVKKRNAGGTSNTDNTGTVMTKIYRSRVTDKRQESSSGNMTSDDGAKQTSDGEPLVEFKICSTPEKTLEKQVDSV